MTNKLTSAEFEFLVSWILNMAFVQNKDVFYERFADAVMRFKMKLADSADEETK